MLAIPKAERRRLAWHLPDDFDTRSLTEQDEILTWVRHVIVTGSTAYRRFQSKSLQDRYAVRFPMVQAALTRGSHISEGWPGLDQHGEPFGLEGELAALIQFKTATLTPVGFRRSGVWNRETALQKVEHLGLFFGALSASRESPVAGRDIPPGQLGLGLLAFPAIWDWYLEWRERRRGFFTAWEVNMLQLAQGLARRDVGWLRQRPGLADRLQPLTGLVSQEALDRARNDWDGVCDSFVDYAHARKKEVMRVARIHRDPFEPILVVLEAASPVGTYRRICDEILRRMPDSRRHPRPTAEAVRSYLMLRLGLHLGVRQKNLRQLQLCPRGREATSEGTLIARQVGEIRWNLNEDGWEVLIPASAFKNRTSSFFRGRPFRLLLPDIGPLYPMIDAYISIHREVLLGGAPDPGTFFVKTAKITSHNAAYGQDGFYEAWRATIQRYGIYNPWTKRGAIAGLLPHGPHNVRDVLATHILKATGSYEQAGYAIQDTPDTVAKHYGRFLPGDKAALAATVLNRAWSDD